jgi:hypothetical protein
MIARHNVVYLFKFRLLKAKLANTIVAVEGSVRGGRRTPSPAPRRGNENARRGDALHVA